MIGIESRDIAGDGVREGEKAAHGVCPPSRGVIIAGNAAAEVPGARGVSAWRGLGSTGFGERGGQVEMPRIRQTTLARSLGAMERSIHEPAAHGEIRNHCDCSGLDEHLSATFITNHTRRTVHANQRFQYVR